MRALLLVVSLHIFCIVYSQQGNELLVYSVKGDVVLVENNRESKLKIGKLVKPGSKIKTARDAKLTMVCKEGKSISVTRPGEFPVDLWKDSCSGKYGSITTKYFQYIWDQLYVRSEDYKRTNPEAHHYSEAPVRGQDEKGILFNELLDTIHYATGIFPLAWGNSFGYEGKYRFRLVNTKTRKLVYSDSSTASWRSLDKLRKYMVPGQQYEWSIATSETGTETGGVIRYKSAKHVAQYILQLKKQATVPEEAASQYFRIAYMLENAKYPADALQYYEKAVATDPSMDLFGEILQEFKVKFGVR